MGSPLDALNAPSSLTARRQAASNLPGQFELPPPSTLPFATGGAHHKYPSLSNSLSAMQHNANTNASSGNLLTPPSGSTSDSNNGGSSMPNGHGGPILPYTPTFFGTPGGSFHTGFTPQPQSWNPLYPPRPMFSPSLGSLVRNNTNSPTAAEGQNQQQSSHYDMGSLPPFQPMMLSPPTSVTPTSQSQAQQQQQALANSILNNTNHMRGPTQSSPMNAGDGLGKISPPSTNQGGSYSSSAQQQSAYAYAGPSPVQQSPQTATPSVSRTSPPVGQNHVQSQHIQQHFQHPPYPSYTMPAMQGPIMTNVHHPGGPMIRSGNLQGGNLPPNFNSGYMANASMYPNQRPHSPPQGTTERPFKCDQCPQSFNRNHDLKRHKRIHLAVKPFPCGHCDKSFSRKDALKVRSSSTFPNITNTSSATYPGQRMRQASLCRWQPQRGRRQIRVWERRRQRGPSFQQKSLKYSPLCLGLTPIVTLYQKTLYCLLC